MYNQSVTYSSITIKNNGQVGISAYITDIEALSEGAPSEFVEIGQQLLFDANEAETASKIAFGVSENHADWTTIYPESENKPVFLGYIPSIVPEEGEIYIPTFSETAQKDSLGYYSLFQNEETGWIPYFSESYLLTAEVGWAWTTEQSLEYAITVVVEVGDSEDEILIDNDYSLIGISNAQSEQHGIYTEKEDGSGITNNLETLVLNYKTYNSESENYNKVIFTLKDYGYNYYLKQNEEARTLPDGSQFEIYSPEYSTKIEFVEDTNTTNYIVEIPMTEEYKATIDRNKSYFYTMALSFYNCTNSEDFTTCTLVDNLGEIFVIDGTTLIPQ